MSREGAGDKKSKQPPAAGTPIWVWVIYGFGILAATVFVFSALFTFGALVPVRRRRRLLLARIDSRDRTLGRSHPGRGDHLGRAPEAAAMRLGRISYVNMAPVFYRLEADVEEVAGVPTELNRHARSTASSTSHRSRRSSTRATPIACGSCRASASRRRARSTRSSSSRGMPLGQVRSVAVTPESATSVVLTKVLLPKAEIVPLGRTRTPSC